MCQVLLTISFLAFRSRPLAEKNEHGRAFFPVAENLSQIEILLAYVCAFSFFSPPLTLN